MRRSALIIASACLVALGVFCLSFFCVRHFAQKTEAVETDELGWLQREFSLSPQEMAKVRELHEGYRPHCRKMCNLIAAKQAELDTVLQKSTAVTPEVRQKISETAALRGECETAMLEHFFEVSRAMPEAQGKRYLEEMRRLTLVPHAGHGSMMVGPDSTHEHGHPH